MPPYKPSSFHHRRKAQIQGKKEKKKTSRERETVACRPWTSVSVSVRLSPSSLWLWRSCWRKQRREEKGRHWTTPGNLYNNRLGSQGSPIDGNLVGTTRFTSRTSGASKLRCRFTQQPMGERVPYLLGSGSSLRSHCWWELSGLQIPTPGLPETPARAKKCQCNLDRWYSDIANSWPKKMENENNNNKYYIILYNPPLFKKVLCKPS